MKRIRSDHTVTGSGLACGSGDSDSDETCEVFREGGWRLLDTRLSEFRYWHSAWLQRSTNTTLILGGGSSVKNVETVTSSGRVAQAAFTLEHSVL